MEEVVLVLKKYRCLGLITQQEYLAVFLRYGLDGQGFRTLAEIAELFCVTSSRPFLILQHAMLKLRCQEDFLAAMNAYLKKCCMPKSMWHAGWFRYRERDLRLPAPMHIKKYRL